MLAAFVPAAGGRADRPNVLLICVDDLRPELGCSGEMGAITPHLDRLAAGGRLFTNHYVQFPTCGASRYSMLTGRRPGAAVHYGNGAFDTLPVAERAGAVSIPGAFRGAGYRTIGLGKISHAPDGLRPDGGAQLPDAWDELLEAPGAWGDSWRAFFGYAGGATREIGVTPAVESADVPDEGYPDGLLATAACERLAELGARGTSSEPFFFAVGFYKPHLPFCAPKRYWDFYERDAIPPSPNPDAPEGVRDNAVHTLYHRGELYPRYTGVGSDEGWSEADRRLLRHGYLACVSYVDAQIGRVLDALEAAGLNENTVVIVWGDHGWHLGDHAVFGKHTTFERALRSTLIVRAPGMAAPGVSTGRIVESLDLFPTLAAVCDVRPERELHGRDLSPLLFKGPEALPHRDAVSYWRRGDRLATSTRTERERLVRWRDGSGEIVAEERYDHEVDPHETRNAAGDDR